MNPLSKKIRSLSLIITLILFAIIGPLVLAYSMGYRIDDLSDSFAWVKTGGIYIHSDVSNTTVYRDGKFVKSGGFFLRNIFIQNLRTDREYVFEVQKDGYHSWVKTLPVVESYVTEARTLMLPIEIEKIEILPFIEEDNQATLIESDTTKINEEYLRQQILFGLVTEEEILLSSAVKESDATTLKENKIIENNDSVNADSLDDEDEPSVVKSIVPEYFLELGVEDPDSLENLITNNDEVAWLENGDVVVHWIGREAKKPFYYCHGQDCFTSFNINWDSEIIRFAFMPSRNDVVVVLNNEGIWAVELDNRSERNIQPIYLGSDLDFRINQNNRIVVMEDEVFYELRF